MARMHARRKGKAGSERPIWTQTPAWIDKDSDEIKVLVVEKAREGLSSAQIGAVLRDSYGIPSVKRLTNKTIIKIMTENKMAPSFPEDFLNLVARAQNLRQHLEKHRKDLHSKRGLTLIESKIRRLVKYYRKSGVFELKFKYEPERAPFYLRR